MRISDWSSDVCSSDLAEGLGCNLIQFIDLESEFQSRGVVPVYPCVGVDRIHQCFGHPNGATIAQPQGGRKADPLDPTGCGPLPCRALRFSQLRSEEPTSELQSLMSNSSAGICLKKKHTRPTQST